MVGIGNGLCESAVWGGELSMYVGVVEMCVKESKIPLFLSGKSGNNA